MAERDDNWIQTYLGKKFMFFKPETSEFDIDDIAHALSNICRFNGHTKRFYSVAEHSVRVSRVLRERGCSRRIQYAGLMHDCAEAYIGDLSAPIKRLKEMAAFPSIEANILKAASKALRFDFPFSDEVHWADRVMLATEARDVMAKPPECWGLDMNPADERIMAWSNKKAKRLFLLEFFRLNPF